jgi:acetylornithine/N-succinyldiaminopimelate aminotransferase
MEAIETSKKLIERFDKFVMPTYKRNPIVISRATGSKVWDVDGREYLDLFAGWGVSGLEYCHPKVVEAIKLQAEKLIHMPNNYYNELQGRLAEKIAAHSFGGKCFFCNSGAEAVEGALKLARKYGSSSGRNEIITMENSFHGRTFGALSATGQAKYREGFGPILPGFRYVPFGDFGALRTAFSDKTCAVMLEPVQGEGGIHVASREYFGDMKSLCSDSDVLLIFDEVQTGVGRTGEYFGYQLYGVEPDVMTLAKALGGGFPIGALVVQPRLAEVLVPGNHASTFGGSPLACAAALAVFEAIEEENLLEHVKATGAYLKEKLESLKLKYPVIKEVRGVGLMVGAELTQDGAGIVEKCMKKGLLINCTAGNVLRFLPAMTVSRQEIDHGMWILDTVLRERS